LLSWNAAAAKGRGCHCWPAMTTTVRGLPPRLARLRFPFIPSVVTYLPLTFHALFLVDQRPGLRGRTNTRHYTTCQQLPSVAAWVAATLARLPTHPTTAAQPPAFPAYTCTLPTNTVHHYYLHPRRAFATPQRPHPAPTAFPARLLFRWLTGGCRVKFGTANCGAFVPHTFHHGAAALRFAFLLPHCYHTPRYACVLPLALPCLTALFADDEHTMPFIHNDTPAPLRAAHVRVPAPLFGICTRATPRTPHAHRATMPAVPLHLPTLPRHAACHSTGRTCRYYPSITVGGTTVGLPLVLLLHRRLPNAPVAKAHAATNTL